MGTLSSARALKGQHCPLRGSGACASAGPMLHACCDAVFSCTTNVCVVPLPSVASTVVLMAACCTPTDMVSATPLAVYAIELGVRSTMAAAKWLLCAANAAPGIEGHAVKGTAPPNASRKAVDAVARAVDSR